MVRRSYEIPIDLFNLTTAMYYGNSTTGGIRFNRATKIETVALNFHAAGTTTNTKQLGFQMGKNASTSVVNLLYGSATRPFGGTTGWKRRTGTPSSAAKSEFTASDRLWFRITNITGAITRLKVVLTVKQ
jgi:hypothetical protein